MTKTAPAKAGHALNPGRIVPGSWGLGVAIRWPDGRPAGALSLAAIENRMRPDRQPALVAALHREVRIIQDSLSRLSRPEPQTEP
ncbi:hypothetical protein PE067_00960 [Paracoccus sp. DMF-8]|uniref:hypothetical protein n=1 Tax=Paracoccus sp. DMF-8 TaxID=3019445 RepID=UPI0023E7A045|nr:hypothetical protein [Paracoccus sp. DMF-8]MDF3604851.1 hypothetical protein [Paracoccus sp. DMF-8]